MISYLQYCVPIDRVGPRVTLLPRASVVGYEVVDNGCLPDNDEISDIRIWTIYNRDGVPTSFAFPTLESRQLAVIACGVQGVGPAKAAGLVHAYGETQLLKLLQAGDPKELAKGVKGLSAKGAAEIISTMKPHLDKFGLCDIEDNPLKEIITKAQLALASIHGEVDVEVLVRLANEHEIEGSSHLVTLYNELLE